MRPTLVKGTVAKIIDAITHRSEDVLLIASDRHMLIAASNDFLAKFGSANKLHLGVLSTYNTRLRPYWGYKVLYIGNKEIRLPVPTDPNHAMHYIEGWRFLPAASLHLSHIVAQVKRARNAVETIGITITTIPQDSPNKWPLFPLVNSLYFIQTRR